MNSVVFFFFFFFVLFVSIIIKGVSCGTYSSCPGGELVLSGASLTTTTFSGALLTSGCTLKIVDSSAYDITFNGAVSNLKVYIRNLDCGTRSSASTCVRFAASVSGAGSEINVDGMTISAITAVGTHRFLHFNGAVSGFPKINIHGLKVEEVDVSLASAIDLFYVHFSLTLTGDSTSGSIVNCSGARLHTTGAFALLQSTGSIKVVVYYFENSVSGFETVSVTDFGGGRNLEIKSTGDAVKLFITYFKSTLSLTGTSTELISANHHIAGLSLDARTGTAKEIEFTMLQFDSQVTGVSKFTVHNHSVEFVNVKTRMYCRLTGVYFNSAALTLTQEAEISVTAVRISCSSKLQYAATDATFFGVRCTSFATITNAKKIELLDNSLHLSDFISQSVSVAVVASVHSFTDAVSGTLNFLLVSGNSFKGKVRTTAATSKVTVNLLDSSYSGAIYIKNTTIAGNTVVLEENSASTGEFLSNVVSLTGALNGNGGAGSILRIYGNNLTGDASSDAKLTLSIASHSETIQNVETLEFSSNTMRGLTASGSSADTGIGGLICFKAVALLDNGASKFVAEDNDFSGMTLQSSSAFYTMIFYFADAVSLLNSFTVDHVNMTGTTVTATASSTLACVHFTDAASITMLASGRISVSNVNMGGSMSYNAATLECIGPRVACFRGVTASGGSITISNNSFDFSVRSSGASNDIIAQLVRFQLAMAVPTITISDNTISGGIYKSVNSDVEVEVARFVNDLSVLHTLRLERNSIINVTLDAGANIDASIARFSSDVSGSDTNGAAWFMTGNTVSGTYNSSDNRARVSVVYFSSGYEKVDQVEFCDNMMQPLSISSVSQSVEVYGLMFAGTGVLRVESNLVLCNNTISNVTAASHADYVRVVLFWATGLTVGRLTVDGADMSQCNISAEAHAQLFGVFFASSMLTLTSTTAARSIIVNDVHLGGPSLTYKTNGGGSVSYGAKVAQFHGLDGNVDTLSVSNSSVDYGSGDDEPGVVASGTTTHAQGVVLEFHTAVSGTGIKHLVVHGNSIRGKYTTGGTNAVVLLRTVYSDVAISGSNGAGSVFTITSNSVSDVTANSNGGTGVQVVHAWFVANVEKFERFGLAHNVMTRINVSTTSAAHVIMLHPAASLTLTGSAASAFRATNLTLANNTVGGSSSAQMQLVHWGSGGIGGIATFRITDVDMRDNIIQSAGWVRMGASFFYAGTLTMVDPATVEIGRVYMGGSITYGAAQGTYGYGAVLAKFRAFSAVKSVSMTHCGFNFTGGVSTTTSAVEVRARMLQFDNSVSGLHSLVVSHNSISGGTYSSTTGSCLVSVLLTVSSLNSWQATINNNSIVAVTATATGAGSIARISIAWLEGAVQGSNSAGSVFNASGNSIAQGTRAIVSSSTANVHVFLLRFSSGVSQYETLEVSDNTMSGMTISSSSSSSTSSVVMLYPSSTIAMLGSSSSAITLRGNNLMGNSVTSGSWCQMQLLLFQNTVSGMGRFTVDGADMRDNIIVSTSSYARFVGVYFHSGGSIGIVNSGAITISDVWLGGSMSYGAVDTNSYGARVVQFQGVSGAGSISIANSLFNFTTGDGIKTSASSVHVLAYLIQCASTLTSLESLSATNNSIRGSYASTGGSTPNVEMRILHAANSVGASQVAITDNSIAVAAASSNGAVHMQVAWFFSTVTGTASIGDTMNVSRNSIANSTASSRGSAVYVYLIVTANSVSQYDTMDLSGNILQSVDLDVSGGGTVVQMLMFWAKNTISLLGSSSALVMRSNALNNNTLTGGTLVVQCAVGWFSNSLSGMGELTVDAVDMSDNVLYSNYYARYFALYFVAGGITMTGSRASISINSVTLGGSLRYAADDSSFGFGAKIVEFDTMSGVNNVSVTSCTVDFTKSLVATEASVKAQAYVVHFTASVTLSNLTITGNSILGRYSASGDSARCDIAVVYSEAFSVITVSKFLLTDNTILADGSATGTGSASVLAFVGHFLSNVAGTQPSTDVFDASRSSVHGSMSSTNSHVCVGVVRFAAGQSMSNFEVVNSTGALVNVQASEGAIYAGAQGTGNILVACGPATSITSTTALTTTTITSTTTAPSSQAPSSSTASASSSTTTDVPSTSTSASMTTDPPSTTSSSSSTQEPSTTILSTMEPTTTTTTTTDPPPSSSSPATVAPATSIVEITTGSSTSSTSTVTSQAPETPPPTTPVPSTLPPTTTTTTTTAPAPTNATAAPTAAPPPPREPTQTRELTVTPMPPTPAPLPIVQTGTSAITATVSVVAALSANPAVGPMAVRAGLLAIGSACGKPLSELDVASSPTRLDVETLGAHRYWAGAVCGNGMLAASLAIVIVAAVYQYQSLCNKKGDRQLNVALALSSAFWLVLSQPVMVGFFATAIYATETENRWYRLVLFVGVMTIATIVVYPLYIFYRVYKEQPLQEFHDEPLPKDASFIKKGVEYFFGSYKNLEWGDSSTDLRMRFGFLFEHTGMMSFAVLEVLCGFAINVTIGTMQDPQATPAQCRTRAIVVLAMHLPPTIFVLAARCMLTRFDTLVTPTMWALNTIVSLLVVLKLFDVSPHLQVGLDVMTAMVGVVGMIASIGLAFDAYEIAMRAVERKRRAREKEERDREELRRLLEGSGVDIDLGAGDDGQEQFVNPIGALANVPRAGNMEVDHDVALEMEMMQDILGTTATALASAGGGAGGSTSNSSGEQNEHHRQQHVPSSAAASPSGGADADIDLELEIDIEAELAELDH